MHEEDKLQEAAYFLAQMGSLLREPEAFRFNLSAFLSAARSVAQYARKQARSKPGGQAWYDGFVGQDRLISFFTSTRDANVHDQLVPLEGHVDVYAKDTAGLWEHAVVETFDRDGNLVEVIQGGRHQADIDAEWTTDFAFVPHYRFVDWIGNQEIPELCKRYLEALRAFVSDGRTRRFLSAPEHAA